MTGRAGAGAGAGGRRWFDLRVECRGVSDVDRKVPSAAPPGQHQRTSETTAASAKPSIGYQSQPRAGGAAIDFDSDGVSIRITYHHDRAWGLVIGFGILAAGLTGFIIYDSLVHGFSSVRGIVIVAAVMCALFALAAAVRGGTPPLQIIATSRGLRMHGGVIGEDLEWRRDEILSVVAEDLEQPHTLNRRMSIIVEFRDDEYAIFPVATREEQAAIVQALRSALKLPEASASA